MTAFRTIVADPPWPERGAGKSKRGADRHYPVLKVDDIPHVILRCPHWCVEADAHLYLWVTNNYLEAGLFVMRAVGFKYVTAVTWAKHSIGLGQYFRGQTEHMLFGVRGKGKAVCSQHSSLSTLVRPPIRKLKHSEKPQEAYSLIEMRSKGPYLELFAREPREGWTVWGNEVEAA